MFQAQTKPITIDEFIALALLPENAERNLEFVNGEILEKMPNVARLLEELAQTSCEANSEVCYVTTENHPYRIHDDILAPDFAYKPTPTVADYPDPEPPLWVAEVISPNDKVHDINAKRRKYVEAGILYWELYPDERLIDVYAPGKAMATYGIDAVIPVEVIAGLSVPVSKLFR